MAALQGLEEQYGAQGFHLLGFYSDDFGMQGGDPDACTRKYMVTFPQFAIDHVIGPDVQPVWAWMAAQPSYVAPTWNFHKYLVSRDGVLLQHFDRFTLPDSPEITSAIEAEL
jgi:glutathione peroxidase